MRKKLREDIKSLAKKITNEEINFNTQKIKALTKELYDSLVVLDYLELQIGEHSEVSEESLDSKSFREENWFSEPIPVPQPEHKEDLVEPLMEKIKDIVAQMPEESDEIDERLEQIFANSQPYGEYIGQKDEEQSETEAYGQAEEAFELETNFEEETDFVVESHFESERNLEEQNRLALERDLEEQNRLALERNLEEQNRLALERDLEEQNRLALERDLEEQNRLALERDLEDQNRLAQEKDLEEQKKQEDEKRLHEEKLLEEEKRIEDQKREEQKHVTLTSPRNELEEFASNYQQMPIFERKPLIAQPELTKPIVYDNPVPSTFENRTLSEKRVKSLNDSVNKGLNIALNDRLIFIKHLFEGKSEDYTRVLSQINTMNSYEEAARFISHQVKPDYNNWSNKEEYSERFMIIVEKRFG